MSFGKSSSNNQAQQQAQSTSTQTLNPQVLAALMRNYAHAQSLDTPYQPYTGEQVAPLNSAQLQAQQGILGIAANNTGGSELNKAEATTNGVAGYAPLQIAATGYAPSTGAASLAGPAAQAAAARIDPRAIQTVSAPGVGADQIAAFLNPYTSDVVDRTNQQLLQQEQQAQEANAAAATKAGAFGGSGSAVQNALTNLNYQQTLGQTDANLNSAGFAQALTAAQAQAAQQLAAAQSNQSTSLAAGSTNANLSQQVALANQAAANSQAQFNASQGQQMSLANLGAKNTASQFNAGQGQAAQAANQSASLAGAGLNLQAGAQQGALSAQQLAQALGIQNAVANVGNQTQTQQQAVDTANYNAYLNAQNWPLMLQQLLNQSLGLVGNPTLSNSQSTSSGSSSGSSNAFNFALGSGGGGGGVGLIGLNSSGPPALPNRFAPVNPSTLQQQAMAAGGFAPAYAPPGQLPPDQTPSAVQALAAAGGGWSGAGLMPITATPPSQSAGAGPQTAAGAPLTLPGLANALNQARAGLGGDFTNIGQAFSNGVDGVGQAVASPFLQFFGLAGGGQGAPPSAQDPTGLLPGPSSGTGFANHPGVLSPSWQDPSQA